MTEIERIELAEIISLGKRMEQHMTPSEAETYKQSLLMEMAYERKMFKALLTNISRQIIINWCLVRYSKLSGEYSDLINHWKTELISHLNNAASNRIKGNDSIPSRIKAIQEVWKVEKEYDSNSNVIDLTINAKFIEEGIPTKNGVYSQVLTDCMTASDAIINVIAQANTDFTLKYVDNL